jgi:hypothetical protein
MIDDATEPPTLEKEDHEYDIQPCVHHATDTP